MFTESELVSKSWFNLLLAESFIFLSFPKEKAKK